MHQCECGSAPRVVFNLRDGLIACVLEGRIHMSGNFGCSQQPSRNGIAASLSTGVTTNGVEGGQHARADASENLVTI